MDRREIPPPSRLYVVMGVAGAGKSLIAARFARALGVEFIEGDDFHSEENVARMAAGRPLSDEHRLGWLAALGDSLRAARDAGKGTVLSCSALKRSYRDILRAGAPDLQLVLLHGTRALLAERLAGRRGHYMPASLLDSQLATLQLPSPDENAWCFDIGQTPDAIVGALLERAAA